MMTKKEAVEFFTEDFPQYVMSELGPSRRQMAYHLAIKALEEEPNMQWVPVLEKLPDLDEEGYSEKMLLSFEGWSLPEIGEYRKNGDTGDWYVGDLEETFASYGLIVNAWMPLPKSYKEKPR